MPSGIKIILLHMQVRVWMKADGTTMQSGEWNSLPVGLCVGNSMVNRNLVPLRLFTQKGNSVNRIDYQVRRTQMLFISQSESISTFTNVDLESSLSR